MTASKRLTSTQRHSFFYYRDVRTIWHFLLWSPVTSSHSRRSNSETTHQMALQPLPLVLSTEHQLPLYREYSSHQTRIHLISFFTQTNLHLYPSLSLSFCLRPTSSLNVPDPIFFHSTGTSAFSYHLHIQSPSRHWLLLIVLPPNSVPLQTTSLILLIPDSHCLPRAL